MASTQLYADVADVRNRIEKKGDEADATLGALISAASRTIDRVCNREDGFVAPSAISTKLYRGSNQVVQLIDECVDVTLVEVKESPSNTTYDPWTTPTTLFAGDGDWYPATGDPDHPEFNVLPYTMLLVDPNGDNSIFTGGVSNDRFWPSSRGRYDRGYSGRGRYSSTMRVPTVRVTARWGYATSVPPQVREACAMQTARWYKRYQTSMADSLATTDFGELRFTRVLDPDVELILEGGRLIKPTASGLR
jgi:hypothetical protein